MSRRSRTYVDRFANEWTVRWRMADDDVTNVTFTCGDWQLVVDEPEGFRSPGPSEKQLQELFCDAERVFVDDGETWYVGYRTRQGRGGSLHGGIFTRFRSSRGEIRYAQKMLHFRHMAKGLLLKHLASARPAVS
jgi:hypothetical protein